MSKKNVRKTIVDGVLSKLLGNTGSQSTPQSHEGSENGDAVSKAKEYIPPSLALKQKTTAMTRSVSHGSVKDGPRPVSRSAMSSPTPTSSEIGEIKPVYVSLVLLVDQPHQAILFIDSFK